MAHKGVKLIVFDFDGTHVDSRVLILECYRAVFTEFGLPLPEDSLALIGVRPPTDFPPNRVSVNTSTVTNSRCIGSLL